ncbi:MAG TPA: hypothetical protein VFX89_03145 [Gammaproteobacteria bacterium]|nr:hypothetical protein [Gammaproteobacteria bacterium]
MGTEVTIPDEGQPMPPAAHVTDGRVCHAGTIVLGCPAAVIGG